MFCGKRLSVLVILLYTTAWATEPEIDSEHYWPQWRGSLATGEAPHGDPPVKWDEETNIRWKIAINGLSHATPVVWGDRIFVLTAVPVDMRRSKQSDRIKGFFDTFSINKALRYDILALNRKDGSLLWRRTARIEVPHEGRHEDGSWASCSPVTDGEYVIASFGSRGFYCYDMKGTLQWERDFGDMHIRYQYGESSSPVLHEGRLVINWDHEGQSFIFALDKATGEEIWRENRDETTTWMTPLVVEEAGQAQVITSATNRVRSYDLNTGETIWEGKGLTANAIPSPVAANGVVYVISGHRGSVLRAIRLAAAKGNIDGSDAVL